jgi:hypothetical protein
VLRKTLVRHTKEQKQGGRALLALPSKSEEVVTGRAGGTPALICLGGVVPSLSASG